VIEREKTIGRKAINVYAFNNTGEFGYPEITKELRTALELESDRTGMLR
jgi:hypothetical protein